MLQAHWMRSASQENQKKKKSHKHTHTENYKPISLMNTGEKSNENISKQN